MFWAGVTAQYQQQCFNKLRLKSDHISLNFKANILSQLNPK